MQSCIASKYDADKICGRIVVCGAVSQCENMATAQGPKNYMQTIMQSIKMQGFTMRDYMHLVHEAIQVLAAGLGDGSLVCRQHVLDGLESLADGLEMLISVANLGKLLIRVAREEGDS